MADLGPALDDRAALPPVRGGRLQDAGPHLIALRLLQCLLDSLAAAVVAWLGRRDGGTARRCGPASRYALYWPAIEMTTWTMTENVHTVLFVSAVVLLAAEASGRRVSGVRGRRAGGPRRPGPLGLDAVPRSRRAPPPLGRAEPPGPRRGGPDPGRRRVGHPALDRAQRLRGRRARAHRGAAFENIWYAQPPGEPRRVPAPEDAVHAQATPSAKRALAFSLRAARDRTHPRAFAGKVRANFWHFLRLEGLHNLLRIERSVEPWRHAGRCSSTTSCSWPASRCSCRSWWPGGRRRAPADPAVVRVLPVHARRRVPQRDPLPQRVRALRAGRRGGRPGGAARLGPPPLAGVRAGALLGLALAAAMVAPFAKPAVRALQARLALAVRAGGRGVRRPGDRRAPHRARGRAGSDLAAPVVPARARVRVARRARSAPLAALERGAPLATVANWTAPISRPRFWRDLAMDHDAPCRPQPRPSRGTRTRGWSSRSPGATCRRPTPTRSSWGWATTTARCAASSIPRGAEPPINLHRLEWNRYDMLGGPQPPAGTHRWSRHRAWLRLRPTIAARCLRRHARDGHSPFPSPSPRPRVTVSAGGVTRAFQLDRDLRAYTLPSVRAVDGAGQVELKAPT